MGIVAAKKRNVFLLLLLVQQITSRTKWAKKGVSHVGLPWGIAVARGTLAVRGRGVVFPKELVHQNTLRTK